MIQPRRFVFLREQLLGVPEEDNLGVIDGEIRRRFLQIGIDHAWVDEFVADPNQQNPFLNLFRDIIRMDACYGTTLEENFTTESLASTIATQDYFPFLLISPTFPLLFFAFFNRYDGCSTNALAMVQRLWQVLRQ